MDSPTKQLKMFKCSHDGKMIFGISIVLAFTKRKALEMLRKTLIEMDIRNLDLSDIDVEELDMTKPAVHVIFDGIY